MKKVISIIITFLSIMTCFCCVSCTNSNKWRETDINGYYTYRIGYLGYTETWSIELYDEGIHDKTKYFVVRCTEDDSENQNGINFYVSYGYYTIEKVYEREEYIEYHLNIDYVVKDKNAPKWNTMTVIVEAEDVYCIYKSQTLYKRY